MVDEPGIRLGLAYVTLILVTLLLDAVHLSPWPALVVLTFAAVGCSRLLPVAGALCTGVSAWAFWNGFVENRLGQLTIAPHDLALLVVVAAGAVAASLSVRVSR